MNIWFRLIVTFIKCLFKNKIQPTEQIESAYIVGPTEVDLRFMNNSRYLLFMEVARFEMMIRAGIYSIARRKKWLPLVVSQTIRYKRPLKRFQKFKLKSRVVGWNEKWFFIEHLFERNGKIAAFGMVKGCFKGEEGVVLPSQVFQEMGLSESPPDLPSYFLEWDRAEQQQERSVQKL